MAEVDIPAVYTGRAPARFKSIFDSNEGGSFGLAVGQDTNPDESIFAAVDDNTASLIICTLPLKGAPP